MKILSFVTIGSTNDYLKDLIKSGDVQNYTVITAESQTKGRGQRGAKWESEHGKNLILSIYIAKFFKTPPILFDLNIIVSLAIQETLESFCVPSLNIKWPNDIISCNKKVGGILIENYFKGDNTVESIIGLGLNVNQQNFEGLPNASSLANVCNKFLDRDELIKSIVTNIERKINQWDTIRVASWKEYENKLFRKGKPIVFSYPDNTNFMGIIQGVSTTGKLKILLENNTTAEFDIKEIQMMY